MLNVAGEYKVKELLVQRIVNKLGLSWAKLSQTNHFTTIQIPLNHQLPRITPEKQNLFTQYIPYMGFNFMKGVIYLSTELTKEHSFGYSNVDGMIHF